MNFIKEHMNKIKLILFIAGLFIALAAAALLFFNIIDSGIAAVIGILGIGLIGASGGIVAFGGSNKGSQQ
jgi:high-affinity Fe2+/Pb2+ permease